MSSVVPHPYRRAARLGALVALVSVAACDCEDRIRRMVSNPAPEERRRVEEAPPAPSGPAEVEPNERPEQATPVVFGGELRPVEGKLAGFDDVDWFALQVDAADAPWLLELSVVPEETANPAIHLGDGGDAVSVYDTAATGEAETIPILAVGRNPVRIAVRAVDGAAGAYTLRFKRRLSGGAVEGEPNDAPEQAIALKVPGEIQGFYDRPEDRDVYRLSAETDAPFALEIGALPEAPQIARIFTAVPFGEPTLSLQIAPGQPARIPNIALSSGEGRGAEAYLVLTTPSGFDRQNAYRVRMTPLPVPPERVLEREPNDTLPQELDVEGPAVVGFIHGTDDVDRFVLGRPTEGAVVAEAPADAGVPDDDAPPSGVVAGLSADAGVPADAGPDAGPVAPVVDLDAVLPRKTPLEGLVDLRLRPLRDGVVLGLAWLAGGEEVQAKPAGPSGEATLCGRVLPPEGAEIVVRPVEVTQPPGPPQPDYELWVQRPAKEGFEVEPNDAAAAADRLDAGAPRSGYLTTTSDVDVYGFAVQGVSPQETRRVILALEGKGVDHEVDLVDIDGGLVARAQQRGPGGGERLALDLPAGIYYARIRAAASPGCEPYVLRMSYGD